MILKDIPPQPVRPASTAGVRSSAREPMARKRTSSPPAFAGEGAGLAASATPTMRTMTSNRFRWAWWLLDYASPGLGLVGHVVPGLSTVPFGLMSASPAARGYNPLDPTY